MELNFEELDAGTNNFNNNYWSNQNTNTPQKKEKLSYDDILGSLNLVVHNGVLQKIQLKRPATVPDVDPQTKNSYIYNKFFKDYKPVEPQKTREELQQEQLQRLLEQKRIAHIKSKKLLFNTSNIHVSTNQTGLNKMFRFSR